MTPRRENFIRRVRRAVQDLQPTLVQPLEHKGGRSPRLLRLDAWATPGVVEDFDPRDFSAEDPDRSLATAVEKFRAVVSSIPADVPLTDQQRLDGERALRELAQLLREIVLREWQPAAEELVAKTETWCADLRWRTRRKTAAISETLLDAYELPQLLIYDEQELFVLSPIARFIPEGIGAYEFSIQPSFERSTIYRDFDKVWYGHVDLSRGQFRARREPWSPEILRACVEELRALV